MVEADTKKYQILRRLFKASDEDFRAKLELVERNLPEEMLKLRGLKQRPHHQELDPLEYTLRVLKTLDTSGLGDEEREILRCVALYHDLGKLVDPLNSNHGEISASMAEPHLIKMNYPKETREKIKHLIRRHTILGKAAWGGLPITEARRILGHGMMTDLVYRHTVADVSSIPGLKQQLPDIHAIYKAILNGE